MDNSHDMAGELLELGNRIQAVLDELFPVDAPENDYLTDAFWYHMRSGGKRVRPAMCLMTCREMGAETEKALYFAAAVEILHNMFLVHDDLQDGDEVRRDAPAVWVEYGQANAINLGDFMLGRACSAVMMTPVDDGTRCRLLEVFIRTYENTCRGQAFDLNRRGASDMNVDEYLRMVRLKTGDYLVLGMIGGAVIAGAGDDVLDAIRELGHLIGPAFQIRDDVIDLTHGKGRGGMLGNDIREGKPSILYAHALNAASGQERRMLIDTARQAREHIDDETVRDIMALYERLGSVRFASEMASDLTRRAFDAVEDIPLQNKDVFRRLVRFMAERTK